MGEIRKLLAGHVKPQAIPELANELEAALKRQQTTGVQRPKILTQQFKPPAAPRMPTTSELQERQERSRLRLGKSGPIEL